MGGSFECVSFTAQLFDEAAPNPYAPAAYAMPAVMPDAALVSLESDLQRLSDLLCLRSGVYNIEARVADDGEPYVMEVSPRGGGNRLSEMLRLASGVDLVRASVQAALGLPVEGVRRPEVDGVWYQEVLHSNVAGIFQGVEYAPGFREAHVADEQIWVEPGARVEAFSAANFAFGSVMVRFETQGELETFRADKESFMKVRVD